MSVAVSNLGKTSLVFVQPGATVDSSYYSDVLLNQRLLPDIHKLSDKIITSLFNRMVRQLIVHDKQLRFCIFICENL